MQFKINVFMKTILNNMVGVKIRHQGGKDRKIMIEASETVQALKLAAFPDEMSANRKVSLIFAGKRLEDDGKLENYAVKDGSVVHAHIEKEPTSHPRGKVPGMGPSLPPDTSNQRKWFIISIAASGVAIFLARWTNVLDPFEKLLITILIVLLFLIACTFIFEEEDNEAHLRRY